MATAPHSLLTVADLERLPDPPGGHYELLDGVLLKVAPPKWDHYLCQLCVRDLLAATAGSCGVVGVEMAFRPTPEHNFIQADVAYLSRARMDAVPRGQYLAGAPELVVEILSPSNTLREIQIKKVVCIANGTQEFWVVNLDQGFVEITYANGDVRRYVSGDRISLTIVEGEVEVSRILR